MKCLIFDGSVRVGNTSALCDKFEEILRCNHEYKKVSDIQITGCSHCSSCSISGETCLRNDRHKEIYKYANECDCIILVSPIHFFSLNASCQAFLERLYSVDLKNKVFGLITSSGSDFRYGGLDLIIEQFKRIDEYCGSKTVTPYNKVTFDSITPVSEIDVKGLRQLLNAIEIEVNI